MINKACRYQEFFNERQRRRLHVRELRNVDFKELVPKGAVR